MKEKKPPSLEQLKQQINSAFENTQYPGDENLVDENASYPLDRKDTKELVLGKRWFELDYEASSILHNHWHCLTMESFRYYVPGIMLCILDFYDDMTRMADCLIWDLGPGFPGSLDTEDSIHWTIKRIEGFSREQRDAIRAFLLYYRCELAQEVDYESVDHAIKYWEKLN